jgi:hypothetical protein
MFFFVEEPEFVVSLRTGGLILCNKLPTQIPRAFRKIRRFPDYVDCSMEKLRDKKVRKAFYTCPRYYRLNAISLLYLAQYNATYTVGLVDA